MQYTRMFKEHVGPYALRLNTRRKTIEFREALTGILAPSNVPDCTVTLTAVTGEGVATSRLCMTVDNQMNNKTANWQ